MCVRRMDALGKYRLLYLLLCLSPNLVCVLGHLDMHDLKLGFSLIFIYHLCHSLSHTGLLVPFHSQSAFLAFF